MRTPISPSFVKPWLPRSPVPKHLFTNVNIIEVVVGTCVPKCSIYLKDGRIAAISTNGQKISAISPDTQEIDLNGKYICPGLIDCHVHISAVPGEIDVRQVMATPETLALLRMTYVCRDILCRGFTTVRDCGGAPYALKQACEEWLVVGPRLFISGHGISQTGGHGDFRSAYDQSDCACGVTSGLSRVCDGASACIATARDELRRGADFIKIMGSGGVVSPTDRLENIQFSPEEIRAFVLAARNNHTYVTCHAYTPESIRIAIENGVRGIEHGNLIDRATAREMARRGCYLTPTLVTYQTLADPALPGFLPPENVDKNEKVLSRGLEALRIAKEEGVPMCYGTDLLGPLGTYQSREFGIRSAVLTPLDILQSATVTPARMLSQETLGQVKVGFEADILILNNNPLEDITVFERHETEVLAVIKGGRICSSRIAGLDGLLDKMRDL
ncbi:hypothetical protein F5B19DRAFT_58556 [Rostrohypoxylon terebratum]|nr:hypothetical protein F5B19DRAFT_58556 [Rostrohypoxylon terebratum]